MPEDTEAARLRDQIARVARLADYWAGFNIGHGDYVAAAHQLRAALAGPDPYTCTMPGCAEPQVEAHLCIRHREYQLRHEEWWAE